MSDRFNVGDTVKLKSGGPIMTVSIAYSDGDVTCVWFDNSKKRHEALFPGKALDAWDPSNDD